jgi:hypothetical protein
MTEAKWLSQAMPMPLLLFLEDKASGRKFRLYATACWRLSWSNLTDPSGRAVIEAAEAFADGLINEEELNLVKDAYPQGEKYNPSAVATKAAYVAASLAAQKAGLPEGVFCRLSRNRIDEHVALLRDIFGNPFRPIAFSPAWHTDTAVALARQMYESRDFSAMPILADALQDAGCDSEDILTHCRGEGPHVRGCWVVDLVLGKA